MNLTAITGVGASFGTAFRILQHNVSNLVASVEVWTRYAAYAPDPMVFDTNLKGKFAGKGATCDYADVSIRNTFTM
jgi:hypothetical protein